MYLKSDRISSTQALEYSKEENLSCRIENIDVNDWFQIWPTTNCNSKSCAPSEIARTQKQKQRVCARAYKLRLRA